MLLFMIKKKLTIESYVAGNQKNERFPDLADLPPELGLAVLSHLNATDLCLAACVWNDLAHDEILWMGFVQYFKKHFIFKVSSKCIF